MKRLLFTLVICALGFGLLAANDGAKKRSVISKLRNIMGVSNMIDVKNKGFESPEMKSVTLPAGEILRLDNFVISEGDFTASATLSYNERNLCTIMALETEIDDEMRTTVQAVYSYNDNGLVILKVLTAEGIDYERYEYTYNEKGLIKLVLCSSKSDGLWTPEYKKEWKYNENNLVSEYTIYDYDDEEGGVDYDRTEYAYNDKGLLVSEINSIWENNAWVFDDKGELTYVNDKRTLGIIFEYRNGKWEPQSKVELSYNDRGQLFIIKSSDYRDGEWIYLGSDEYKYNEQGNILLFTSKHGMTNVSKQEYVYDNNTHVMSSMILYDWRNDKWEFERKCIYEYYQPLSYTIYGADNGFNIDESHLLYDLPYIFHNEYNGYVLSSMEIVDRDGGIIGKSNCSYTSLGDEKGVKEAVNSLLASIYPNPTSDVINIEVDDLSNSKIEVYNMRGQLLIEEVATPTLSLKALDAGIYLVKVIGTKGQYIERIVKR